MKIISVVLISFACMQWNDADALKWILIYLCTAFAAWMYQRISFGSILVLTLAYAVYTATYIPHLWSWWQDDMPSVVTSMQAATPYIELVREAGGLVICLIVSLVILIYKWKNRL